jgi:transcriptional regulator with XRE-family HTH domain
MAGEMIDREPLQKLLGQRLRELRTQQGRSQKEFADSCGIPRDRLERIEQGEIDLTLSMIVQLAQNLETEAHAIFDGIG